MNSTSKIPMQAGSAYPPQSNSKTTQQANGLNIRMLCNKGLAAANRFFSPHNVLKLFNPQNLTTLLAGVSAVGAAANPIRHGGHGGGYKYQVDNFWHETKHKTDHCIGLQRNSPHPERVVAACVASTLLNQNKDLKGDLLKTIAITTKMTEANLAQKAPDATQEERQEINQRIKERFTDSPSYNDKLQELADLFSSCAAGRGLLQTIPEEFEKWCNRAGKLDEFNSLILIAGSVARNDATTLIEAEQSVEQSISDENVKELENLRDEIYPECESTLSYTWKLLSDSVKIRLANYINAQPPRNLGDPVI